MKTAKTLALVFIFFLSGCWSSGNDLVQNGILCVDVNKHNDVPIKNLFVNMEDSQVVVKVVFQGQTAPSSVTVSLVSPSGKELSETIVRTYQAARRSTFRHFEARLDVADESLPLKGSTLRISY